MAEEDCLEQHRFLVYNSRYAMLWCHVFRHSNFQVQRRGLMSCHVSRNKPQDTRQPNRISAPYRQSHCGYCRSSIAIVFGGRKFVSRFSASGGGVRWTLVFNRHRSFKPNGFAPSSSYQYISLSLSISSSSSQVSVSEHFSQP